MKTFFTILDSIRKEAFTEKDKGNRFERLMRDYFLTSKKYNEMLTKVWLWSDFPFRKDFGGKDTGIDLVAKATDGSYWAIQCKCYLETANIDKPMVDSFLATSSRTFMDDEGIITKFSTRLWVSTTSHWGANARETIRNQDPPVLVLNQYAIASDATVDWDKLDAGFHGKKAVQKKEIILREHQKKALAAAHEYYKQHERGQMIMACGTGKTFTSLKIVENETQNKGFVLVLVPSIALINQTLNEWIACSDADIYPICVCSDRTASRARQKDTDDADDTPVDLAMPACTNVKSVAKQIIIGCQEATGMVVVFSTYQSIDIVGEAQKYLNGETTEDETSLYREEQQDREYIFDYIICDEAHRTTGSKALGKEASTFTKVHDNKNVKAKKRLYMTATPRLYRDADKLKAQEKQITVWSMDDKDVYGEEFYHLGFGDAVEQELLADYKVLILTVRDDTPLPLSLMNAIQDKNKEINTDDAIKLIGCINALSKRVVPDPDIVKSVDPALMHRAVAFCPRITASKAITDNFNEFADKIVEEYSAQEREETVHIQARHIDGSMNADERNSLVNWLRSAPTDGNECRILDNVRCLSEGVDVPSLDAIIFLSSKNSQIEVVQSVGRVMRTAPGKKYGYIIIPVMVPAEGDPNTILDNNDKYKVIWDVLNALRAHDERFNSYVNKIDLDPSTKPTGGSVIIGGGDGTGDNGGAGENGPIHITHEQIALFTDGVQRAIYAKMVEKVGTKRYWEQWAEEIAEIAQRHEQRIRDLVATDENYKTGFEMFMEGLHKNINPNVKEDEAIEMLGQHLITRPVFEALFEDYSFEKNNPISNAMSGLLDLMDDTAYEKDNKVLDKFYKSVREHCRDIHTAAGKQRVIVKLYDTFFKKALPQTVNKLGIVYTPVEVVDFINKSVADVLKKEFNRSLSDENIHIIDPFTGTGTFITRMLQSGLIDKQALARKYKKELHANELVLLAYYIASVNIENAYHDMMEEQGYSQFEGICLTDTFQLYEDQDNDVEQLKYADLFPQNSVRVIAQNKVPMQVIVANPPYSVGQTKANDNAQNQHYSKLEEKIAATYVAGSTATNKNALYDSYIKAFRWASDRLDPLCGGIIGFVTNGGWLDGSAMDGMRKCLEKEFSSIYVYNLRGNARTSGEQRRKEKDNVFGQGSRAPIAITILVKNPRAKNEKARIYYHDIGDYLTREEKLKAILDMKSVVNKSFTQKVLKPNEHGDWLSQRSDVFGTYITIESNKKFDELSKSVFCVNSRGLETARDTWIYNSSREKLCENVRSTVKFYNRQVDKFKHESDVSKIMELVDRDKSHISWSSSLFSMLRRTEKIKNNFEENLFEEALYRPFCKQNVYLVSALIHRYGQMKDFFGSDKKNLVITCPGPGGAKEFSTLITNRIPDLEVVTHDQCFPLYWYEKTENKAEQSLFDTKDDDKEEYTRHDGVTDYILKEAQEQYKTKSVTKEDIFYYVYGLLHSEEYRQEFAADLKKMLPRIPLVETAEEFKAFAEAGRKLADLHLHYENRKPPAGVVVEGDNGKNYEVTKIRYASKEDMSKIIYNDHITISNIPAEAYEYVVNGRTAIGWILERYQIKTDKDSGIVNDPNDWGKKHGNPRYILDLLLSIITVSVETMKIVKSLPKIKFDK